MKPLEKEFFKIISGWDFDKINPSNYGIEQKASKAAAALCEEKIKAAIELAREYMAPKHSDKLNKPPYTPEEILQKLNEQK